MHKAINICWLWSISDKNVSLNSLNKKIGTEFGGIYEWFFYIPEDDVEIRYTWIYKIRIIHKGPVYWPKTLSRIFPPVITVSPWIGNFIKFLVNMDWYIQTMILSERMDKKSSSVVEAKVFSLYFLNINCMKEQIGA